MLKKGILAALVVTGMMVGSASAMSRPVTIEDQGSFLAGGTVVTAPGKYDGTKPMNLDGETLHGDHAYVFYQKPVKAHKYGCFPARRWTVGKDLGDNTGRAWWFSEYLFGTGL